MKNFIRISYLSFMFCLLSSTLFAQSVIGTWKTIDDETNKPRSIVEISETDGVLTGIITSLFREPHEEKDPDCVECEGDDKNRKIIGLDIIRNMSWDDDAYAGGTITDPETGKVYSCKLWMGDDGNLQVRGYVAFFFRTQEWLRVE